jgi:hypothetical protein
MNDWQLVSKYRILPSSSGPPTLPPTPRVPKKKKNSTLVALCESAVKAKELQNLAGYDSRCPTDRAKVQI